MTRRHHLYAVAIDLPDGLSGYVGNPAYRPGMHAPLAPVSCPLVPSPADAARRVTAADATLMALDQGWPEGSFRLVELDPGLAAAGCPCCSRAAGGGGAR